MLLLIELGMVFLIFVIRNLNRSGNAASTVTARALLGITNFANVLYSGKMIPTALGAIIDDNHSSHDFLLLDKAIQKTPASILLAGAHMT